MNYLDLASVLRAAGQFGVSLEVRFALLANAALKAPERDVWAAINLIERTWSKIRVPRTCQGLALLLIRITPQIATEDLANSEQVMRLLEFSDAFRKPDRFNDLLLSLQINFLFSDASKRSSVLASLKAAHLAASSIDTHSISVEAIAKDMTGPEVGAVIRSVRKAAIERTLFPEI